MPYRLSNRNRRAFYTFIAPWLFGIVFLQIFPLLWGFVFSLSDYTGLTIKNINWIGLANYVEAFQDPSFLHGLGRTALVTAIAVPLKVGLGLFLALQLQKVGRGGAGIMRTLLYVPVMLPMVAQAFAWKAIFHPTAGFLNGLLTLLAERGVTVNWMAEYPTTLLIALFTWAIGETVVIFFAALMTLPDELIECAEIDGASNHFILWQVKIPLMSPIVFLQFVMNMVKSLQLLTPALLLIPPGSQNARRGDMSSVEVPTPNRLSLIEIYEDAFIDNRFAYALSESWIFFLLVGIVALIFWRVSRRHLHYESDIN